MAEKNLGTTYASLVKALKARQFSPVYLLMGEEPYYIDKISDYIANHVMAPEMRDFNQSVVFGADVTAVQVADLCREYPMMSEYRVVVVKEAQNLKGWEPIERYLDSPVKSTILVICHKNGSIDKRKKIVGKAAAVGVVFESAKPKDWELPAFIENYLKARKATVEPKASQMIADHVGADLARLSSELDKVLISLPENDRRVTPDIVERKIGVSKEFNGFELRNAIVNHDIYKANQIVKYNGFELRNAIVNHDIYKANQIVKYFDSNPKAGSIYTFLPLLFSYFQNLMIAYYAPNKNNEDELARYLDLRGGWAARDYQKGMRNYTGRKVMQIIEKCREVDAKSKGLDNVNTTAGDLMKELLFFIFH